MTREKCVRAFLPLLVGMILLSLCDACEPSGKGNTIGDNTRISEKDKAGKFFTTMCGVREMTQPDGKREFVVKVTVSNETGSVLKYLDVGGVPPYEYEVFKDGHQIRGNLAYHYEKILVSQFVKSLAPGESLTKEFVFNYFVSSHGVLERGRYSFVFTVKEDYRDFGLALGQGRSNEVIITVK